MKKIVNYRIIPQPIFHFHCIGNILKKYDYSSDKKMDKKFIELKKKIKKKKNYKNY